MAFRLIVTEEQRRCLNGYLHTEGDFGWLHDTETVYPTLAELVFHVSSYITQLNDSGWRTHILSEFRTAPPWEMTVDLTGLTRAWAPAPFEESSDDFSETDEISEEGADDDDSESGGADDRSEAG